MRGRTDFQIFQRNRPGKHKLCKTFLPDIHKVNYWTSTDFYQGAGDTQPRNVTRQVWKYFARYASHWLEKTRPAGQNRNSATEPGLSTAERYAWDKRGIDGLRCDFGQGLPPQAWEYMINHARVQQINNAGVSGPYSTSSAAIETLDPAADRDGDGQNNSAEHAAGTNPLDSSSVLKAISTAISGGDVIITIATVPGKIYQLETSTTLLPGSWQEAGDPIQATGTSTQLLHPGGAGDPRRFYRARVVP